MAMAELKVVAADQIGRLHGDVAIVNKVLLMIAIIFRPIRNVMRAVMRLPNWGLPTDSAILIPNPRPNHPLIGGVVKIDVLNLLLSLRLVHRPPAPRRTTHDRKWSQCLRLVVCSGYVNFGCAALLDRYWLDQWLVVAAMERLDVVRLEWLVMVAVMLPAGPDVILSGAMLRLRRFQELDFSVSIPLPSATVVVVPLSPWDLVRARSCLRFRPQ
jgi:hypothetical protein